MTRVSIIYQSDPLGVIPGGIDPFIRGIIKWSPDDIEFELVGITTEPSKRPVGQWSEVRIGSKGFRMFPLLAVENASERSRIPLSLRFTWRLLRLNPELGGDVLEFHRIEPSLACLRSKRPKNLFVHQNMEMLLNPKADVLWRHVPKLFYWLEDLLIPRMDSLYTVTEGGAEGYCKRYPGMSERIHFISTWMDPEVFRPPPRTSSPRPGPNCAAASASRRMHWSESPWGGSILRKTPTCSSMPLRGWRTNSAAFIWSGSGTEC